MTPLYPIKTLEKCIKVEIDYGFGTTTNARNSRDATNLKTIWIPCILRDKTMEENTPILIMYKINTSED